MPYLLTYLPAYLLTYLGHRATAVEAHNAGHAGRSARRAPCRAQGLDGGKAVFFMRRPGDAFVQPPDALAPRLSPALNGRGRNDDAWQT